MATVEISRITEELLPLLRRLGGSASAIALGGAHAKGAADDQSDLDIYIFCDCLVPNEERASMVRSWSSEVHDVVCWDAGEPFEQAGTDFYLGGLKVECWLRNAFRLTRTVKRCLAGDYTQELVTWTPTGFYSHCCLSDLKSMVPLDDPRRVIAKWKALVEEYPPALREAIIGRHLGAARFWPHNFHYSSAVQRCDLIYTSSIVQQTVHNLIQVVFAVNRTYFPGDKKLAQAMAKLAVKPERFVERIERLLAPGRPADLEELSDQQTELQGLLADVGRLVEVHMAP